MIRRFPAIVAVSPVLIFDGIVTALLYFPVFRTVLVSLIPKACTLTLVLTKVIYTFLRYTMLSKRYHMKMIS